MPDPIPQNSPAALAQQQRVDATYAEYTKVAGALSDLVTGKYFGEDVEARHDPDYRKLRAAKLKAFNTWQREAQAHGHMFTGQDK